MTIQDAWEKALKKTDIVRPRVQPLHSYESTRIPYVFLAASSVNSGDTVVRKGEVIVEKPSIILPFNLPQFEGFEFEGESDFKQDFLNTFFLVRGVSFPSFKYNNQTSGIDVHEGKVSSAIKSYMEKFQREEDVHSGLLTGPEDVWQFSVLLFVGGQIARSAEGDIRRLMDDYKKKGFGLS